MKKHTIIFFCVFAFFSGSCFDLTKVDFYYLYSPDSPVGFEYRMAKKSSSELLLFGLLRIEGVVQTNFYSQENYEDTVQVPVAPVAVDTLKEEVSTYLRYEFDLDQLQDLLVLVVQLQGSEYYFPIEIRKDKLPTFYPWLDGPMVTQFAWATPQYKQERNLQTYVYSEDFGSADPPFGSMQALSPVIEIDTVLRYSDTLKLTNGTFYFLQEDTTSVVGSGFLKCPPYFPRYRKIEELLPPMEYICSSREYGQLIEAPDQREAFEAFWVRVANGKSGAKRAIRNYFRGVTLVNRLFTNYKPGWQTDQGMIYLIYGTPDQVFRNGRKEVWKYGEQEQFEFVKISTLFAPSLYTLIRDTEYRDSWTQRIKSIRAGL